MEPNTIKFSIDDVVVAEFTSDGKFKYKGKEVDDVCGVYASLVEWMSVTKDRENREFIKFS